MIQTILNEIIIFKWTCFRCYHEWIPKRETKPTVCPRCNSPYWYKARTRNIKKVNQARIRRVVVKR